MQSASSELMRNGSGTGAAQHWPGGEGVLSVRATFGGGNVAFQCLGPNATWLPVPDATTGNAVVLTTAGTARFALPPTQIRAVATTATAVYASAARVPH